MFGRGLLGRLRGRPAAAGPIGRTFTPAMEAVWPELEEAVDGYLKKVGSSVVASWEVATTELARATNGIEGERALLERYSDAIVPTLSAFQDLHKGCPTAMVDGLAAGRASKDLARATLPLLKLVDGLDGRAVAGWQKTVAYLDPVFAKTTSPDTVRATFAAHGDAVGAACRAADQVLRDGLARSPLATSLEAALSDALDAWQAALTRELEIVIYRATQPIAAAVRAAR